MRIGIFSKAYIDRYGLAEGAAKMKKHGYDAVDYGGFVDTEKELFQLDETGFIATLAEVRAAFENNGIEIYQTHGPWRHPIHDGTAEERAERFDVMAKSIRGTALLGCKYMVLHPIMPTGGSDTDPELTRSVNIEFFRRLGAVAREWGVTVCLENMPFLQQVYAKPADTLRLIREIDDPAFRMCLDTGHAVIHGISPADAVREIGKEKGMLCTLHIHDSDGQHDNHWLPGKGVIDWKDFYSSLREIGYNGVVSIETMVPKEMTDGREEEEIRLANMVKNAI